jgi:cell division protein FtsB
MKSYNTLKQQRIIAQDKLAKAKYENEQLHQEVEYTKTDDFVVQKARELLGYVKPGEVKFVDKN